MMKNGPVVAVVQEERSGRRVGRKDSVSLVDEDLPVVFRVHDKEVGLQSRKGLRPHVAGRLTINEAVDLADAVMQPARRIGLNQIGLQQ